MNYEYKSFDEWLFDITKQNEKNIQAVQKRFNFTNNLINLDDLQDELSNYVASHHKTIKDFHIQIYYNLESEIQKQILQFINDYEINNFFIIHDIIIYNLILKELFRKNYPYKTDKYNDKVNTEIKSLQELLRNNHISNDTSQQVFKEWKKSISPNKLIHYLYNKFTQLHGIEYSDIINKAIEIIVSNNYSKDITSIKNSPVARKFYNEFSLLIDSELLKKS